MGFFINIYIYIYIYIVTYMSIGYIIFSFITLVYVRHFASYLVSNISLSCFCCMGKKN